jgi:hypothetical protein
MDHLIELQKRRRKRGLTVIVLALFFLAYAIRTAIARGVPMPVFLLIYSSGLPLGAGIATVVASYRVMREIGKS